jgi:cysteine desulfurase family protein
MIYLDNAATSHPKPAEPLQRALARYLELGTSPGRGGYDRAVAAEMAVAAVRQRISGFFGAGEGSRVCFAANATDALNTLIQGLVSPGDHVISSRLEHNSVLRPLHHLKRRGIIDLDLVPFDARGQIDLGAIEAAMQRETRLVVVTHASNVLGTIQPVAEIGAICRKRGVPLVLDTAQSAGLVPISMADWQVQGLAFTGHKSLLGPTGIGGLVFAPELDPKPIRYGGTGTNSDSLFQPQEYPNRLEPGTINLFGILALEECVDYLAARQTDHFNHEMRMTRRLIDGLAWLPKVRLFPADLSAPRLPLIACVIDGITSQDAGAILDGDFDIAVRAGLHCAPLVHQDLKTLASGAIRFSPGPCTTEEEIDRTIEAMAMIAR